MERAFTPSEIALMSSASGLLSFILFISFKTFLILPVSIFSQLAPETIREKAPDGIVLVPAGAATCVGDLTENGGSFLCSAEWCQVYQPGACQLIDSESPSSHTGFRCAMDAERALESESPNYSAASLSRLRHSQTQESS